MRFSWLQHPHRARDGSSAQPNGLVTEGLVPLADWSPSTS